MALIKFGGGIADMRGSIAGTTFARNRFGAYARNRTKPVNPNSSRQVTARNNLSSVVQAWYDVLTAVQRANWATYAAAVPWINALGESQYLTGFNMFVRSNLAVVGAGLTRIDAAPSTLSMPNSDPTFAVVATADDQKLAITFNNSEEWANESGGHLLVYGGQAQKSTRNFYGKTFRYADKIAGSSTTPPTTGTLISTPFGIAADQKVWVTARILRADGRLSKPFRTNCTVSAT